MALTFRRIDKCWQNACHHTETDVDFFLEENDWDDFGFQTFYHFHASKQAVERFFADLGLSVPVMSTRAKSS